MRSVHRRVGSGRVPVDEDPVDVVAQAAEAGPQPFARRGGASRAVSPLRGGLDVDELRMHELFGQLGLAPGEETQHHRLDSAAHRGRVRHGATMTKRLADLRRWGLVGRAERLDVSSGN